MTLRFEIQYDSAGKPVYVNTDDGFVKCSRPFNPEEDGWMEDQLNPNDFPIVRTGKQMEALVHEVNRLRRENFRLKKSEEGWMRAAGFGTKKAEEGSERKVRPSGTA